MKTAHINELAIIANGYNICYVPCQKRTKELCELAFAETSLCLKFIPIEFRTKQMYKQYLKDYGHNYVENISDLINPFFSSTFTLIYEPFFLKN
jgi:hypothetical protein